MGHVPHTALKLEFAIFVQARGLGGSTLNAAISKSILLRKNNGARSTKERVEVFGGSAAAVKTLPPP